MMDVGASIQGLGRKVSHLHCPSPPAAGSEDTTRNWWIWSRGISDRCLNATTWAARCEGSSGREQYLGRARRRRGWTGFQGCARKPEHQWHSHGQPVPPASKKQLSPIRGKSCKVYGVLWQVVKGISGTGCPIRAGEPNCID